MISNCSDDLLTYDAVQPTENLKQLSLKKPDEMLPNDC